MKFTITSRFVIDVAIWKLKGSRCKMCHKNKATTSVTTGDNDMCQDCTSKCIMKDL